MDLLKDIISKDYSGLRGIKGPEGFITSIAPVRTAFPDIYWTIENILAEGDQVMVMWSWKGTNTATFDGFPVSNVVVTHHAINIFRFNNGKIVEAWMRSDRLGFYQQIGVISEDAVKPRKTN